MVALNTLRPRQNGLHFANNTSKKKEILLYFVSKGPINNIPALDQTMAWLHYWHIYASLGFNELSPCIAKPSAPSARTRISTTQAILVLRHCRRCWCIFNYLKINSTQQGIYCLQLCLDVFVNEVLIEFEPIMLWGRKKSWLLISSQLHIIRKSLIDWICCRLMEK